MLRELAGSHGEPGTPGSAAGSRATLGKGNGVRGPLLAQAGTWVAGGGHTSAGGPEQMRTKEHGHAGAQGTHPGPPRHTSPGSHQQGLGLLT